MEKPQQGGGRLPLFVSCLMGLCTLSTQTGIPHLQGIVGESVTFPAPVFSTGTLIHGNHGTAAMVLSATSRTDLLEQFRGRLQWHNNTGFFIVTNLKIQDSGEYKVENNDGQKMITTFQLTVYNRVPKPQVSARHSCSVLCSVENGRDVTLSWYRGNETLNQTSSPDLESSLSLPLEIEHRYTYYCETKNPVSSQRLTLEITQYCSETPGPFLQNRLPLLVGCCALIILILIIIGIYLKKRKKLNQEREDTSATTRLHELSDITEYAEVKHNKTNKSQQGSDQCVPELGPGSTPVKLTTVYEELRHTS